MELKNIIVVPPLLANAIFGDLHLHALEACLVDAFSDYDVICVVHKYHTSKECRDYPLFKSVFNLHASDIMS